MNSIDFTAPVPIARSIRQSRWSSSLEYMRSRNLSYTVVDERDDWSWHLFTTDDPDVNIGMTLRGDNVVSVTLFNNECMPIA